MQLERYQVISKIGRGKYCSVYRVRRKADLQQFALKQVKLNMLGDCAIKNVLSEAKLLKKINNENIIKMIEAFVDQNNHILYIVLELAQGDLGDLIEESRSEDVRIRQELIWSIAEQVGKGLLYLHSNNILHRDIKPTNILKFADQLFKISDFNVSKSTDNLTFTRTGTLSYASPEIWKGLPYDSKSDIWSFGCLLYELACLKKAFWSESMDELYGKVTKCQYVRISEVYSRELRDLIMFMIQVNPKLRPSANTILKMCENRKKSMRTESSRAKMLTPIPQLDSRTSRLGLHYQHLRLSSEGKTTKNRQRLYSLADKKSNQPTLRKLDCFEVQDKLSLLQSRDIAVKKSERSERQAQSPNQLNRRRPRILYHKLNKESLLCRPRRNTQI